MPLEPNKSFLRTFDWNVLSPSPSPPSTPLNRNFIGRDKFYWLASISLGTFSKNAGFPREIRVKEWLAILFMAHNTISIMC